MALKHLTNLIQLNLCENPQLRLPPGAPLDEDGDPYYDGADAVRGFLDCL